MLFKRVIPNIKQQNWLAVALDFLVVVFGVFLGLQVSLWNEERKAENDTQALLERLKSESILYVNYWRGRTEQFSKQVSNHLFMLNALNAGQASEEDLQWIELSLSQLFYYPAISPPDTVLSEILDEHQYNALKDERLKSAVTSYDFIVDMVKGQLGYFRSFAESYSEAYDNRVYYRFEPESEQLTQLSFDFSELAANEDFKSKINRAVRSQYVFQSFRLRALEAAIKLCNVATSNSPDCQKSP